MYHQDYDKETILYDFLSTSNVANNVFERYAKIFLDVGNRIADAVNMRRKMCDELKHIDSEDEIARKMIEISDYISNANSDYSIISALNDLISFNYNGHNTNAFKLKEMAIMYRDNEENCAELLIDEYQ